MNRILRLAAAILVGVGTWSLEAASGDRWSAERANAWYAGQPWLVGCNYAPATAINQLEMWQAETFDVVVSASGKVELRDKAERGLELLKKTFAWAREVNPSQPLTTGIGGGTRGRCGIHRR